jgi:hypothetical protein
MNRAARVIASRPSLLVKGRIEPTTLYGDLAIDAARHNDRAGAADWLERGRKSEPPLKQAASALFWELLDLQVKMIIDEPEVWVPALAVILDRYRGNQEAFSAVLMRLIELGLVKAAPDPKNSKQILLDTRVLEHYLGQYGPRITTASGSLGAAASRGAIWTPETATAPGSASPIWTPGSAAAAGPATARPRIIQPGS